MQTSDLLQSSLTELAGWIARKEVSPVELTQSVIRRIEAVNPHINAFLTVIADAALEAARQAEAEILKGNYRGALHGIPYGAKDLLCTMGIHTTCGAKILQDNISGMDATVVEKMRAAGAILVGKTHLHEFAFGVTNHNTHFGPARNPWDVERITGGSSGGSAAAVAAGCVPMALGSDTGGSIRIPAALCGLVGFKPTYGRVSKFGVYPLADSMDHIGPLTRTTADAAAVLQAVSGVDPQDATTADRPVEDFTAALEGDLRGLCIGLPHHLETEPIEPEIKVAVISAVKVFEEMGAVVQPVKITGIDRAAAMALLHLQAEAGSVLAPYYNAHADKMDPKVKERLDEAHQIKAVDFLEAARYRQKVVRRLTEAFEKVDLLLTPATAICACKITADTVLIQGKDVPVGAAVTRYSRIYNFTGQPALVLPCGLNAQGLPVAVQLVGRAWEEALVLKAAHLYQQHGFTIAGWPTVG